MRMDPVTDPVSTTPDAAMLAEILRGLGGRRTDAVIAEVSPQDDTPVPLQDLAESARLAGLYADLRHAAPPSWPAGIDGALIADLDGRRYAVIRQGGIGRVISDSGEEDVSLGVRVAAAHPVLHLRALPEDEAGRVMYAALRDRARRSMRVLFVLSLLINAAALTVPFFSMAVYGLVLGGGAVSSLSALMTGAAIVLAAMVVLRQLRTAFLAGEHARLSVAVDRIVMTRLLRRPAGASASVLPETQRGLARQAASAADLFSPANMMAIYDGPFIVLTLVALVWVGGVLALVPLTVLGVFLLSAQLTSGGHPADVEVSRAAQDRRNALATLKEQALWIGRRGLRDAWLSRFDQLSRLAARDAMRVRLRSGGMMAIGSSVGTAAALATLVVGLTLALEGTLQSSVFVGTMLLTWRLTGPAQALYMGLPRIKAIAGSWQRLERLLLQPTIAHDTVAALPLPAEAPSIEASGLYLRHDKAPFPALSGVSFKIEPGQVVAVIGPNGAGKSSVLNLLAGRAKTQSGALFLAGRLISQYDPDDLSLNIATVGFPHGSEPEDLTTLSEAEREYAEWRAFTAQRAPLCLLDNPLPIGGSEARADIAAFLAEARGTSTVVFSTHDTDLVQHADVALVLDKGAVVYFGPVSAPATDAPDQAQTGDAS